MKRQFVPLALLAVAAMPPASAQNLQAVITRMDAAAPQFKSLTAKMVRQNYVAIIKDTSEEAGSVRILRAKPKDLRVSIDMTVPDAKQVELGDKKAQVFYPKMNTVQVWDLGKYKSLVDQFVLLGFGTSGKDLMKAYEVKYLEEDNVGGQKCSRLELTPKAAEVRQHFSKFELCVAFGGYPVRQKLVEPSGNYSNISYTDIRLNPDLTLEQMALKLPKDVKREFPQR